MKAFKARHILIGGVLLSATVLTIALSLSLVDYDGTLKGNDFREVCGTTRGSTCSPIESTSTHVALDEASCFALVIHEARRSINGRLDTFEQAGISKAQAVVLDPYLARTFPEDKEVEYNVDLKARRILDVRAGTKLSMFKSHTTAVSQRTTITWQYPT